MVVSQSLLDREQRSRLGSRLRDGLCAFASLSAGIVTFCLPSEVVRAQVTFPSKEIVLIVPFAAGGPTDIVARIVAERMSKTLGQQIQLENVIGSGGATAAIRAKRSPPDGYTIMMGHMGTHAAAAALNLNLAYSPSGDFEPIGSVANMPVLILARKDFPAANLEAFVSYLRASPAPLKMAHAGAGSVSFTTCQLLNLLISVKPKMVAFQGTGPAMDALSAGQVDYMCDQIVTAVPQVAARTIRAYAIGSPTRNPALPDVPVAAEAGLPGFQVSAWNALFAPKGTPQDIIIKLNSALVEALDDEGTRKRILDLGGEIPDRKARTPQSLADLVASETAKWSQIIKSNSADR